MCLLALFCYLKGRSNNPNLQQDRPNLPFSGQARHALQINQMYGTSAHETSQTELETTQVSGQTDDNAYNQINEEDVYVPSDHSYCEIKDEDASGETEPVIENNDHKNLENNTIDNTSEQGSQTENCEDGDDSVTFYAKPILYQTSTDNPASVNRRMDLENLSVTNLADQDQTAYDLTDRTDVPTRTDTNIYGTSD
ncbi:Hypp2518 [Branchiostoma lanceolatum]|uniref:Hypp2518 protein n=1 Tax=Branchiostoma lanceolatum TaxID=7740 RepID=A0A8J9ZSW8_BRALA|nr:Hypp2518 [Branchiostoma lanceolatum]